MNYTCVSWGTPQGFERPYSTHPLFTTNSCSQLSQLDHPWSPPPTFSQVPVCDRVPRACRLKRCNVLLRTSPPVLAPAYCTCGACAATGRNVVWSCSHEFIQPVYTLTTTSMFLWCRPHDFTLAVETWTAHVRECLCRPTKEAILDVYSIVSERNYDIVTLIIAQLLTSWSFPGLCRRGQRGL